ncbi:hypothetical protein BGW80DRAFT_1464090 [Lactifluus volemus]|nr:hypothetical protein BGW80DRAFT_1464090 [Lactifluus volemus]
MSVNAFGKPADTVDFGGEVDYASYEWFKDPPPRQEPPPQPPQRHYTPLPSVIEKNEMCDFALQAAPNVLFGRYKQYGQLGVLACRRHVRLTREAALKACEEVLRLQLDIKMQIIVLHLSSQVARLRRFLDANGQWNDYPETDFPIDPTAFPPS